MVLVQFLKWIPIFHPPSLSKAESHWLSSQLDSLFIGSLARVTEIHPTGSFVAHVCCCYPRSCCHQPDTVQYYELSCCIFIQLWSELQLAAKHHVSHYYDLDPCRFFWMTDSHRGPRQSALGQRTRAASKQTAALCPFSFKHSSLTS